MNNKINEITDFLMKDSHLLVDHIRENLKIQTLDVELSFVIDHVSMRVYKVSFEEIVKATRDRIVIAIESFKE